VKDKPGGWAGFFRGCRAVGRARGSLVESMASRRKVLLEMNDYRRFIGGDSVS
jgi:hypothetical protein